MITEVQRQGIGNFAERGFTLEHDGDTVVFLHHEGEALATFSQLGATEQSLQEECARHLVMKHGWDGCLWTKNKEANHGQG